MATHNPGPRAILLALALLLAAGLVAGCGPYRTYRGRPKAFSTHPYRLVYPKGFEATELPQMSREVVSLIVLAENKPIAPQAPEMPAIISVRCYRMHKQETPKTFMERYYDELEPRFLDIEMRQVSNRPDASEWTINVAPGYYAARVIVLPREKLAYDIMTVCKPSELERFKQVFQRARDSFQLLPARS